MSADLDARLNIARAGGFRLQVDLAIPAGRTVALLGPNGAGKSTAVAALAGLVPLHDGHIRLGTQTLDDPENARFVPPEKRRIGVVFQDYLLFPHLSVLDNVAFGLRSTGTGRAEARERAIVLLSKLEVGDLAESMPAELSGGQAQRIALARALVTEPELLLLDEPLAALDVTTRARLRHLLSDHLEAFPGPRLLITHEPTEAFLLADEIHVIEEGTITQTGSADDIRLRPRTPYIADLAGSNLLTGRAADGEITVGDFTLRVADTAADGAVLATIHPRAISLHLQRPEGSPRNTWQTSIMRIDHHGDRVRVQVADPLHLTAEITPGAMDALRLALGSPVWLSVKATEIGVEAD